MADERTLYESMYILDVTREDDEMRAAVNAVEAVIEEEDGEVTETVQYGRRPLAYRIGPHTEGIYIITYFRGGGNVVRALNNEFRTLEPIIRGIVVVARPNTIYKSDKPKPSDEEAKGEAEAEEAAEAEETEVVEETAEEPADEPEEIEEEIEEEAEEEAEEAEDASAEEAEEAADEDVEQVQDTDETVEDPEEVAGEEQKDDQEEDASDEEE
ncbi:MAG: 30S ribosomal protein S6 [Armatimonadota bacterium]